MDFLSDLLPALNAIITMCDCTVDRGSYSCFISSVTPPMNRLVSRLRPSVPRGLSPSMCGSLSTLSTALRRLRVTISWCQRPWLICTLLTTVPVPEPVLNLRRGDTKHVNFIQQSLYTCITLHIYNTGGVYFQHNMCVLYWAASNY